MYYRFQSFAELSPDSTGLLRFFEQLDATGLRFEVVVMIDNLDLPEAFLSQRLSLYSGLRQVLDFSPDGFGMKLIASAASEFLSLEPSIVSKLLSRLQVVSLEALTLGEAKQLMSKSPLFDSAAQSEALKDFLFDQCGGHPALLQEVLSNLSRNGNRSDNSFRETLEKECNELSERGGNFFQQYMGDLAYEDIIYLLAIALQASDQEWHPPQTVITRFVAAGLIREGPGGLPEPSCRLFFRWFRHNVANIFPGLSQSAPMRTDHDSLVQLLQSKLRLSIGATSKLSEKIIQDVVNIMLVTASFNVEKEVTFYYREKAYRTDFALPDLRAALEIKLVKSSGQVGQLIEELEADLNAYQSHYRYLFVLIYDLTGSARIDKYVMASENPFVRYVTVRH